MKRLIVTLTLTLIASTSYAEGADLERAYLKELAFLKAEKASLEARVRKSTSARAAEEKKARRELESLEGRVIALRRRADDIEEKLREADRNANKQDRADLVLETIARTREALSGIDLAPLPDGAEADPILVAEAVTETFSGARLAIAKSDDISIESGKFFLEDGTEVDGKIARVGMVAAYGVSDRGSGALAPAGAGRLRLWPDPAKQTAQTILAGDVPSSLRVFLYESTDKAMSAKEEKSVLDELRVGGSIAWVIAALGLLALIMIVFRAATVFRVARRTRSVVAQVVPLVRAGQMVNAQRFVEASSGAAARVLGAILRNVSAGRARLDDVVEEALLVETPAIERFGTAITVFAAVAPLLGLLGTVTGMIATFDVITEFGTGDPRMLSGGISEALITTKLGLIVAIPSLLLGTLLSGRADAVLADIEHAALAVINASEGLDAGPTQAPPSAPSDLPAAVMEPT